MGLQDGPEGLWPINQVTRQISPVMMDAADRPEGEIHFRSRGVLGTPEFLIRFGSLTCRCLATTIAAVLAMAISSILDVLALQEVNISCGSTGLIKNTCF